MTKKRAKLLRTLPPLQDIKNTLEYCDETFYLTCDCGRCDPCTQGREGIRRALQQIQRLQAALQTAADV